MGLGVLDECEGIVVMDKEQAPSRNEGCRTFLPLLLVLPLGEARSGVSDRGETCSLRKAKSTWLGTLPLSPQRRRIVWGRKGYFVLAGLALQLPRDSARDIRGYEATCSG